jgi:hypothetical protein
MSRRRPVAVIGIGAVVALLLSAGSCNSSDDKAREALQAKKSTKPGLEHSNLARKRQLEENPNAVGYVYLMNYGQIVGYYVSKGKISSNGSQATPEQDIHWTCKSSHGCSPVVVDGPQDDGSFGGHDPGIFFFTADGAKVVTSLDYIHSDQPLAVNAPRLSAGAPGPAGGPASPPTTPAPVTPTP